jgi:hypothetical protein
VPSVWQVRLQGEALDLAALASQFPSGQMFAGADKDGYFAAGAKLEEFHETRQVREAAQLFVDEASAVISLSWRVFRKLTLGAVYRLHPDGGHDASIELGSLELRIGGPSGHRGRGPTGAQQLLAAAQANPNLHRALLLWSVRPRAWYRLYTIVEEISNYLEASVAKAGFCSKRELVRFTNSANHGEVAGLDARHAQLHWQRPSSPMTLVDAESFVGGLLEAALRRAGQCQTGFPER